MRLLLEAMSVYVCVCVYLYILSLSVVKLSVKKIAMLAVNLMETLI